MDDFIAQGREVLDNLNDQKNMLKGTQRRLLDAANTLGLSRDVIGWIEKRRSVFLLLFSLFLSADLEIVRKICISFWSGPCLHFSVFI